VNGGGEFGLIGKAEMPDQSEDQETLKAERNSTENKRPFYDSKAGLKFFLSYKVRFYRLMELASRTCVVGSTA
jgi:hypothetical protein